LNIHVPNLRNVFMKWLPLFSMTRRSRDSCNQYAIQGYALCLQKINQKQQIGKDKPQWKKVKLSSLCLPFLSKGYTCFRKIYSVAARVKTLSHNRFLTLKMVFEAVSIRCRFRNFSLPISSTRSSLWLLAQFS